MLYPVLVRNADCDATATTITPSFRRSIRSIVGTLFLAASLAPSFTPNIVRAATSIDEVQLLLSEARVRITEGRIPEAIKLYRRVTSLLPTEPNVRKELARLLARHMDTRSEAEKVYAEVAAIMPDDASLASERAGNLAVMGDYVNASLEYRRAFELKPDDDMALAGYVKQITRLGSSVVAVKRVSDKLVASPRDFASRLILAELFRKNGRYDDAMDQFSLVLQANPNNLIALRGTAEAWLSLGFYDRAAEAFQKADKDGGRGRSLANQARVLLLSGRPEAVLKLFNTNLKDVDKEPLALIVLADMYRSINQPAQERATLERLILLPSALLDSHTLERLARIRFETGEKATSIATCRQLLNYDPQNAIGAVGLSLNGDQSALQARENSSLTPTRRAAKEQAEAEAAIFWNLPEKAIATLNKSADGREDCPRLLLELGRTLLRRGDTEASFKTFAKIAINNGKWLEALSGMAQAEMLRGNSQRALALYAEVLEDDPSNFRALAGKADTLYQMGRLESAAVILNGLHKSAPESNLIKEKLQKALSSLSRAYKTEKRLTDPITGKDSSPGTIQESFRSDFIRPVLKAGDAIRITAVERPGLSTEVRLDDDGKVTLPFLPHPIRAACKTEQELTALVATYGGAKLAGTTVSATITSFHQASLLVSGAVYIPGQFNIRKPVGLLQALMLASGADQRAGRVVYVLREVDACVARPNGQIVDPIEVYERSEVENGTVSLNRPLQAGDAVIVPEKDSAFIVGEVARPGAITLVNKLRLVEALTQSGGVLAGARRDYLKLSRPIPGRIALQQFIINLEDIVQHRTGDVLLLPGDIVEVTSKNKETTISHALQTSNSTAMNKPAAVIKGEPTLKSDPLASVKTHAGRVRNAEAIDLPSPVYPELARRRRATGNVAVRVMIDVNGTVLSAKALSGNIVLQEAAVKAALRARFSPTTLSGQPVNAAVVINYKFAFSQ